MRVTCVLWRIIPAGSCLAKPLPIMSIPPLGWNIVVCIVPPW
jgi:hypothetical protein